MGNLIIALLQYLLNTLRPRVQFRMYLAADVNSMNETALLLLQVRVFKKIIARYYHASVIHRNPQVFATSARMQRL
jgi:hypothetical protein